MDAASILLVLATLGVSDGSPRSDERPTALASAHQSALGAVAVHHTAFFAGQPGWSSDATTSPPAAAPSYDRYGTPINVAAAPPSVVDRTRVAVVESGNALRDGVETGFQEADRQLTQGTQQFIDNTRTAAQDASSQFQGWAGSTAQQAQDAVTNTFTPPATSDRRGQVTNPFAPPAAPATTGSASATRTRNGVQPPPWAAGAAATNEDPSWPPASTTTTQGATVTSGAPLPSPPLATPQLPAPPTTSSPFNSPRTAQLPAVVVTQTAGGGWTTVNANAAAPPMIMPRLVNTLAETQPVVLDENGSQLQPLVGSSGPGFPNNQIGSAQSSPPPERSVLAQTQPPGSRQPAAETADDFSIGWDRGSSTPQQATIGGGGRYDSPPAGQQGGATGGNASQVTVRAPSQQSPDNRTSQFDQWAKDDLWSNEAKSPQGNLPAASQTAANPASATTAGNTAPPPNTGATPPPATTATNGQPAGAVPPASNDPWIPLVLVSAGLAGSIGANFFLGWSYMDARQKYRHLVQKTANKFRRVASAA